MGTKPGKLRRNCQSSEDWDFCNEFCEADLCSDVGKQHGRKNDSTHASLPIDSSNNLHRQISRSLTKLDSIDPRMCRRGKENDSLLGNSSSFQSSDTDSESPDLEDTNVTGGSEEEDAKDHPVIGPAYYANCQMNANTMKVGNDIFLASPPESLEEYLRFNWERDSLHHRISTKLKNQWRQTENTRIHFSELKIDECPSIIVQDLEQSRVITDCGNLINSWKKTYFLEGCLGVGKTTYLKQIAVRWSKGIAPNLNHFDFVFFLQPQDFSQSLERTIINRAKVDDDDDERCIKRLLQNDGVNYLIMIDSFESLSENFAKEVHDLVANSKTFPLATVIVSAQPMENCTFRKYFQKCYEAIGFEQKQIEDYCRLIDGKRVKNGGKRISQQIKKMFDSNSTMQDFLKKPLFLRLICEIAEDEPEHQVSLNALQIFQSFFKKLGIDTVYKLGEICARFVAINRISKEEMDKIRDKDKIIKMGLVTAVGQSERTYYQPDHRSLMDYVIAEFLVHEVKKMEDFSKILYRVLGNRRLGETLLLRFVFGLMPLDKKSVVFKCLPRYLTRKWNLELIRSLGENDIFKLADVKFLKKTMPDWLQLTVTSCLHQFNDDSGFAFINDVPIVRTSGESYYRSSLVKMHITDLLSHRDSPIKCIQLDFTRCNAGALDFALDLFSANFKTTLQSVTVVMPEVSKKVAEIVGILRRDVKEVAIKIANWSADDDVNDECLTIECERNSEEFLLQSLEISVASFDNAFKENQLRNLFETLNSCHSFRSLKLGPISDKAIEIIAEKNIFLQALTLNVVGEYRVTGRKWTGKKNESKTSMKRSSSEGSVPLSASSCDIVQKTISRLPYLTYLDISNYQFGWWKMKVANVIELSKLQSLILANCMDERNRMNEINLYDLVSEGRIWDELNFCGWKIYFQKKDDAIGEIRKLVMHDSEVSDLSQLHVNLASMKVRKLCCDSNHVTEKFTTLNLSELKLKMSECSFADKMQRVCDITSLSKIEIECKADCDVSVLKKFKRSMKLRKINLCLTGSDKGIVCRNVSLAVKLMTVLNIDIVKINLSKLAHVEFSHLILREFVDNIGEFLNKKCGRKLSVMQTVNDHRNFLQYLENAEQKHTNVVFRLKVKMTRHPEIKIVEFSSRM